MGMDPNSQNLSQDPHHAQNNVSVHISIMKKQRWNYPRYFQAQPGYGGPMGPGDLGPCDEGAMCPPGPGPPFQNQWVLRESGVTRAGIYSANHHLRH